jgi:hypothetical protein
MPVIFCGPDTTDAPSVQLVREGRVYPCLPDMPVPLLRTVLQGAERIKAAGDNQLEQIDGAAELAASAIRLAVAESFQGDQLERELAQCGLGQLMDTMEQLLAAYTRPLEGMAAKADGPPSPSPAGLPNPGGLPGSLEPGTPVPVSLAPVQGSQG